MVKVALVLIVLLGIFLRWNNLSPYKFYPDSYQSLLVSENIEKYHSVVGFLGEGGMLFPDFVAWTRSGYPLLIDLGNLFVDRTTSAEWVAFLAGILGIPLAFLLIKNVFKNEWVGIMGAFLIAISFNHVVWGGFILTESVGVMASLLLLWLVFRNLDKKSSWANWEDFLIGGSLGFAFLTRYEYLIWILPIGFLLFRRNPTPWVKFLNILVSFLFLISIFVSFLFPLRGALSGGIFQQIQNNIWQLGIFLIVLITLLSLRGVGRRSNLARGKFWTRLPRYARNDGFKIFLILLVWIIPIILWLQPISLVGVRNFFWFDLLMGLLILWGMSFLIKDGKYGDILVFVVISAICFFVVYYQTNPLIQRYPTHMMPILLIPASFGLARILKERSGTNIMLIFLMGLVSYQIGTTNQGIKHWDSGEWERVSYEEKAAKTLVSKVNKDDMLLVSFPESYFYHTQMSTNSLIDSPPFIFIDDEYDKKNLVIVMDMGMKDQFPNFFRFVKKNLKDYKKGDFWVREVFHFANRGVREDRPVEFYALTVANLKDKIKKEGSVK